MPGEPRGSLKLVQIPCCDRVAPVFTEASLSDARAYGRLAALVFTQADKMHHAAHVGFCIVHAQNLAERQIVLHIRFDDAIEYHVRRQIILIGLVGAKFS